MEKNTEKGCHFLHQGTFPIQGLNSHLLHWQVDSLPLSHQGNPHDGIIGHGTTDRFQIGKGVHQGCLLSPYVFSLYAEYIMRNAGLDEAQAGIKIAGRNISNLRYADDTSLTAESEEELKSLLMHLNQF